MREKRYKRKIFCCVLLSAALSILCEKPAVCAENYNEYSGKSQEEEAEQLENRALQEILDRLDFQETDQALEELFPEQKLDFKETVMSLITGEHKLTAQLLNRLVADQVIYAFRGAKENLGHIVILAVVAAVLKYFSRILKSRQIAEVSFYLLYLLLLSLCLNTFGIVMDWVNGGVEDLTSFMGAFCPLYFLAVAVAKGSVTAAAFYQAVLFLIYLIEVLVVKVILPAIHIYIMVKVLNFLSEERYLSRLSELLEMGISWALKSVLALVIGINVVQGLINPAIDMVKRSAITRGAEAIPGIGDAVGGVTEVVLGTAVLVKNGIGMTGAVICVALCLIPLLEIGCIVFLYKLAAALLEPVSDSRVIGCIESVSEGGRLLMKVVFTVGLLFLITIVIVSAVTGNV